MLFIVMPLIVIYTAIISVYFLTILISVSMPQGVVANLVLWYGAVTTLVMFLIHPLKEESRWAQLFTKVLSIWILPLLILMFVAMGIRIAAHGVTVNRYFVLALGTWVLVSMLYFVFFKGRRNVFLIASLALFVILSVIGPWSAFSVSFASQRNRLTGLLEKYHMLEGGTVKKPDTVVSVDDQVEISSILAYLTNRRLAERTICPQVSIWRTWKRFSVSDTREVMVCLTLSATTVERTVVSSISQDTTISLSTLTTSKIRKRLHLKMMCGLCSAKITSALRSFIEMKRSTL